MSLTSKIISDEMYSIAANEENIAKNRDRGSLPCKYFNRMSTEEKPKQFKIELRCTRMYYLLNVFNNYKRYKKKKRRL